MMPTMPKCDNILPCDRLAGQQAWQQQIDNIGVARAHAAGRAKHRYRITLSIKVSQQ